MGLGSSIEGVLVFNHFSCIVINRNIKIKKYTIYQSVTIGRVRGSKRGVPIIGVKIIGKVKIGNYVVTGAVVVNDIPDNSVAIGVPAKASSYNGQELVK